MPCQRKKDSKITPLSSQVRQGPWCANSAIPCLALSKPRLSAEGVSFEALGFNYFCYEAYSTDVFFSGTFFIGGTILLLDHFANHHLGAFVYE